MDCRNEKLVWKENIDEEGRICHCNDGDLCNANTPNITQPSTLSSSISTSTASVSISSITRKRLIFKTTISNREKHETTTKEVIDPILGQAELTIGIIIYLFLLHCLYSAAPPYGNI